MTKTIVKLGIESCVPCKMVSNFLEDQGIEVIEVNVEEAPEIASNYNIMSVPTTILFSETGLEIDRTTGFKPEELIRLIEQM